MDLLYQFNLRLHHFWDLFFFSMLKKNVFQKLAVCDYLAKSLIMLGFIDLKWRRVTQRSNVGLVFFTMAFDGLLPLLGDRSQSETHFLCP